MNEDPTGAAIDGAVKYVYHLLFKRGVKAYTADSDTLDIPLYNTTF